MEGRWEERCKMMNDDGRDCSEGGREGGGKKEGSMKELDATTKTVARKKM